MSSNVIQLPRPRGQRPSGPGLGFYVRVGRNDHVEMLHLISTGERGIFGFIIDAHNVDRHRDLIVDARRHGFDVILDPKTQRMGLPGGHSDSLAALPWGLHRHHHIADFEGSAGRQRAEQIVDFALTHGFSQIIGPTHLLGSSNDPWLRRDIAMMNETAEQIARNGADLGLVYSLALPMALLRQSPRRRALIDALRDARCDAIWLKIENFGDDATGEKTAAYIEACRDFHDYGLPVVGDHVGGLPALAALALGAIGGISHGVTIQQNFKASAWRQPRAPGGGGSTWRVYFPQLDMMMKPATAQRLLGTSTRVRALCGCRDTHCCPHGPRDMLSRPARHAIYQRAREIERVAETPQAVRAARYLDDRVRRVSDFVTRLAAVPDTGDELQKALQKKQGEMSRFRETIAHLVERPEMGSIALTPSRARAQQQ